MGRMGMWVCVVVVVVVAVAWQAAWRHQPPVPALDPDPWWAPGHMPQDQPQDTSVTTFRIAVSQQALDDFSYRLALPPRLTPALQDANFTYGVNPDTLQAVLYHWRHRYDWRQREARLNSYPHYKTNIEGLDIHFLRARAGKERDVVPLLLVHGWPGSFAEFYNILPLLTNPEDNRSVALEVICPSIPGYGFSQASAKQGFGHLETAQIFLKLMKRLGYERFYVQGGDWGAYVLTAMATMYPQNVLGVHLNMVPLSTPGVTLKTVLGSVLPAGLVVSQADQAKLYPLSNKLSLILRETGYMHIQATKPDTIGTALDQSPVSLLVYILEKFSTWTNPDNLHLPDGGLFQPSFPIDLDSILDNICIYWFTNSITTSLRYYSENFNKDISVKNVNSIPCVVPAGMAIFPNELARHPKNFAAHKFYDIVSYNELPVGGHFAAMEQPHLLAKDLLKFINIVEERRSKK